MKGNKMSAILAILLMLSVCAIISKPNVLICSND